MSHITSWREAFLNLLLHKARSTLAILGIVFGVASVICMLSVSEVARRDAVSRIERMGLKNIILDSVKPSKIRQKEENQGGEESSGVAQYGLTREDVKLLAATLPVIEKILPIRMVWKEVFGGLKKTEVGVLATTSDYPAVMEHAVRHGRFLAPLDEIHAQPVCVLGHDAAQTLFPLADPLDRFVTIGGAPFRVVGVMMRKGQSGSGEDFANPDQSAFIPLATSFARFGAYQVRNSDDTFEGTKLEVNRAVLQMADTSILGPTAQAARNLMEKRHRQKDVQVTIPFHLLAEHQRTERIFLWVMGSLAAVSLLVGGIGIMNIMLANIAERRSEVGLRRALGATRGDILRLFLAESTLLCTLGGLLGLAVGVGLALGVGNLAGWAVAFKPIAFPLGLGVAVLAGLVFGTLPARQAARQDPVLALRSE